MNYQDFIKTKEYEHLDAGFVCSGDELPVDLKEFQRDIVKWGCKRGRAAIFADTGLGKTFMQLSWAKRVQQETGGNILVLAPLCVAQQTVEEGSKFGIDAVYIRDKAETDINIHVTNYEMLKNFDPANYSGIVLDESSILKGMEGKLRRFITDFASTIPYRLSCTATPSPNDFMELGTQSEFLGVMSQVEMLATFFIHDGSDTSKWRLKGHARRKFWEWLSTWAVVIRKPSDLGYESEGYDLPPLKLHEHIVETAPTEDLFVTIAQGLQDRNKARRESVDMRCAKAAEIMSEWDCGIAWTNLNDESEMIAKLTGGVECTGSDSIEHKELAVKWFLGENVLVLNGSKRKKLCLGNQNMLNQEERNTQSQKKSEKEEEDSQEAQNKTGSICKSTTKKINQNIRERQNSKKKSIDEEGKDTQKIKSTESEKRAVQKNINSKIQNQDLDSVLISTELRQKNIGQCSIGREAGARYADAEIAELQKSNGCTLTTVTQREKLEGYCVQTAIKESESLKTQQDCSEKQRSTSKILVTKPRMFGYGLNLQHCNKMVFVGLSDSFEAFYQAVRRCWRFGQTRSVDVHIVVSDREGAVLDNIKRKQQQHDQMSFEMSTIMRDLTISQIKGATINKTDYLPQEEMTIPTFL